MVNRNGKGKEFYNNGKLKFEGEYLNGKRWNGKSYDKNSIIDLEIKKGNGKGKEYNNYDELEFEGEYLNGERWNGKVKEYNYLGRLIFEGEYLNGERNGKGKEYNLDGNLEFEGEYLNGKEKEYKNEGNKFNYGKGELKFEEKNLIRKLDEKRKVYNNNEKLVFEGEYLNGKDFFYNDEIIFERENLNGKRWNQKK